MLQLDKVTGAHDCKFDCAYFSGSITLLPDVVKALHIARGLVKPDGRIYITQTFQFAHVPLVALIKPLLRYVTTIGKAPPCRRGVGQVVGGSAVLIKRLCS